MIVQMGGLGCFSLTVVPVAVTTKWPWDPRGPGKGAGRCAAHAAPSLQPSYGSVLASVVSGRAQGTGALAGCHTLSLGD